MLTLDWTFSLNHLFYLMERCVCFPALTQTHMCVCFGTLRPSTAEPIRAVNPSPEAPGANETFLDREWLPPALRARPDRYSSCTTYFTATALPQQAVEGKERDLSIIR